MNSNSPVPRNPAGRPQRPGRRGQRCAACPRGVAGGAAGGRRGPGGGRRHRRLGRAGQGSPDRPRALGPGDAPHGRGRLHRRTRRPRLPPLGDHHQLPGSRSAALGAADGGDLRSDRSWRDSEAVDPGILWLACWPRLSRRPPRPRGLRRQPTRSEIHPEEIHRGIAANEFLCFFQPQVTLQGALFRGVEALVRWRHPEFGLLGPAAFLPQAEADEDLISDLTLCVLARVAEHWQRLATAWSATWRSP